MQIIPVIDLKNGQVVHAKRGERSQYAPINSPLCANSAPVQVVAALLTLYPFACVYIADLDAIMQTGNNDEAIAALQTAFPTIIWWLDNGIRHVNARALYAAENIRPIIGSEAMPDLQTYRAVSYACHSRHVLSLDSLNNKPLGTAELHETGLYWPDHVIAMRLSRVGSAEGPDLSYYQKVCALNNQRKKPAQLYAAGGVRKLHDLCALKALGFLGALVATALYDGSITGDDLVMLCET